MALLTLLGIGTFTRGEEFYAELLDLKDEGLQEAYSEEVPVSGRVIAGVSFAGTVFPGELAIFPLGASAGDKVCVQIMSRDGRYWAENNFLLPDGALDGPIQLRYDSHYADELQAFESNDLAILSRLGACDDPANDKYVLSSRGKLADRGRALLVFVNSARADTYAGVMNRPDREKPRKCRRIVEGRRTGYDTICEIALREDDAGLENLEIKVYRRKYEKSLKPETLLVVIPR
ncbi:MAG: hypothetical protein DRR04_10640 [Gammaproteobacteria bacterium]|nr:MAG: hypothetical protein DRQ97_11680 [Gammaproteobacteria bacterium]RLA58595.1 MAG: hypothetical protein DRR04_10640 [Gammaproteobacteria bacterium]